MEYIKVEAWLTGPEFKIITSGSIGDKPHYTSSGEQLGGLTCGHYLRSTVSLDAVWSMPVATSNCLSDCRVSVVSSGKSRPGN